MKEVTKYESSTGKLFDTEQQCKDYEQWLEIFAKVKADSQFVTGSTNTFGFMQIVLKHYTITPKGAA